MKKVRLILILTLTLAIGAMPAAVFAQETSQPEEAAVTEEKTTSKPKKDPVYKGKTGVFFVNGKWRYYKKGHFKKATGIAKRNSDGKQVYVQKGIFKPVSGVAKRLSDGKLLYVRKGIFKPESGVAKRLSDGAYVFVKKGVFKTATGLAQVLPNKNWVYVKKGFYNKKMTGLVRRIEDKQWAFVKNGNLVTEPKKIFLTKADEKAGRTEILAQVYARTIFNKVTTPKMSKNQKMKATFMYVANANNYRNILSRIPYYHGNDWPIVYANDMIRENGSTCFGFSALYGYLAKLCGCKNVYWCSQGYHAWVEVDGLIYDPIFLEVSSYKQLVYGATYAQARAMNIGTDFDNSGYPSNPWMRIRVPEF